MDTGRLKIVRSQENGRRKFAFMLNDVIKSQCEFSERRLKREKIETSVKLERSLVSVRRAIVKQRVLQHCLRMKRRFCSTNNENLGAYGGKPLYAFSRDIDRVITYMHPRRRRLRQTEKNLQQSIDKGQILDPLAIPGKMEQCFQNLKYDAKNVELITNDFTSKDTLRNRKNILPPLNELVNPLYNVKNSDAAYNIENNKVRHEKKHKNENEISDSKRKQNIICSGDKSSTQPKKQVSEPLLNRELSRKSSRVLLILPPIQQTKQMSRK